VSLPEAFWNGLATIFFAGIVYVLVRPQSNAASAVTAVTDTLANVVKMALGGA
jgi:uncharacterized membrane protein YoaK (UPF0700 family)